MSRNKRKTSALQAVAVTTISALFILTALFGLYKCFSQEPTLRPSGPAAPDPDPSAAQEPENPEDDARPLSSEERKEHFYTVLMAGLDDENGGSDTNLLMALDAENGTINVVSLPRDTLLNVSWSVKKLNNAYHHGGISQTRTEVSRLLGIPVDYYVTVDLRAFVELVDAIDGVDFDIPVDMDYDDPEQDLHIHFKKGPRHLTGQQALEVVRWRQNNDGTGYATADIGRIGTQQAFLTAVAKQTLQVSNLDKIPEMAEIFSTRVETDLKLANLIWIGEQALSMGSDSIAFHTLPGDGAGYYKGGSYYVLDPEGVLELIDTYFNPYRRPLTREDMDILVP
ncbi:MAG: LCP family protein [Oscillospiraceae bacterium]|mgnify:FL=1|jgi:LCP family protein required for cell wall assembly|nr:LCP family protein [Oscillospiraceae bacterium]MCI9564307.1 LCP family protein [Oscillospiraceae bacterium]